jgi:hypothetical protein
MMLVSSLVVLLTLSYSSAQRITCASLNVDSTKQFQNCVSRVLGSAGMITAGDQFTSCGSMVANQARYLECVCTKSEHLADWYASLKLSYLLLSLNQFYDNKKAIINTVLVMDQQRNNLKIRLATVLPTRQQLFNQPRQLTHYQQSPL